MGRTTLLWLSTAAVLAGVAVLASCDDECGVAEVEVCDENGEGCDCAVTCALPVDCPPGRFCADSIGACVWLQPGQLVEGCGRSGEKCCELPAGATPNACAEPLLCDDLVCVEGP